VLKNNRENKIIGDNTIKSIYVDVWMPVWLKIVNPQIKMLVLLRDPVKRSFSRYSQLGGGKTCGRFLTPAYCKHHFDEYVSEAIAYMKLHCPDIKPHGDPSAAYHCMQSLAKERIDIDTLVSSLYSLHLRHWLNFFPPEQFLIVESNKLFRDQRGEMNRIVNWLGLEDYTDEQFEVALRVAQEHRFQHRHGRTISEKTKKKLQEFFAPYVEELREVLHEVFHIEMDI